MKKFLAALGVVALLVIAGCSSSNTAPAADSDSSQKYKDSKVPVDNAVYTITGTVTADVKSLTRQTSPGGGSISGGGSAYGFFVGGSFFGPTEAGKGFVRVTVKEAAPKTELAPAGETVVLKMTDTKGTALLPGDVVTFKCRRQYEAIAAVLNNQTFDANAVATWELDYCRLASPIISK